MAGFEETYPALARFMKLQGWIEVGSIAGSQAMIQLLDEGGTIWQGDDAYATLDDAFRAADHAAAEWWQDVMSNA